MLARLPPGLGAKAVLKLAMDEKDEEIRDRCLDEVVRMKDSGVASLFIGLLVSKDNKRVNRRGQVPGPPRRPRFDAAAHRRPGHHA